MPKNSFLDWSTTASDNTDIGGIGTQGTNLVSNFDDAFRTLMAQLRSGVDGKTVYLTKSGAYTAVASDNNAVIECTAALTLSLTAAATLGANWHAWVYANGGDVTVDPNSTELINGVATIVIPNGCYASLECTGSAFRAIVWKAEIVKIANYTAVAGDNGKEIRFTVASTLSLTAAATLGPGWRLRVKADGVAVTIDPNGSETVNGSTTATIASGQTVDIVCDGSSFVATLVGVPAGPQLQGYSTGLALTTNATDAANDVDIAVGAAAADTSPYYLMQLTSALTKRIDAAWAVGTNQGGLDTGSVTNATYYIWLIQRSDTGVVDALFSLSSTAPTMPASYDRKRLIGTLIRASSTNGGLSLIAPFLQSRAAGYFIVSGTTLTEQRKIASSVTRIVTGVYEVTLATAAPDVNYIVQVTGKQVAASSVNTSICEDASFSRTTTAFRIRAQASDGSEVDPSGCSYEVKW